MGEDVATLGLFTLHDFNSTEPELRSSDHLFCISYYDSKKKYDDEIMLIWCRDNRVFSRNLNHEVKVPVDMKSVNQMSRLLGAATDILLGKPVNLLEI